MVNECRSQKVDRYPGRRSFDKLCPTMRRARPTFIAQTHQHGRDKTYNNAHFPPPTLLALLYRASDTQLYAHGLIITGNRTTPPWLPSSPSTRR